MPPFIAFALKVRSENPTNRISKENIAKMWRAKKHKNAAIKQLNANALAKQQTRNRKKTVLNELKIIPPQGVYPGGSNYHAAAEHFAGLHGRRMAKTRRNNRSRSLKNKARRGGGYLTDQQYFDPDVLPPSSLMPPLTSLPTSTDIRPVMIATAPSSELMAGGGNARRRTRRSRGGFSPSVMGSFIANAQSAIVPAALYLVYNQFVPKKNSPSAKLQKAFGRRASRRRTH